MSGSAGKITSAGQPGLSSRPTSTPMAPSPPASPGLLASARLIARDIKLAHSVFALPFAILAAFMARPDGSGTHGGVGMGGIASVPQSWSRFAGQAALVGVCMVLARTWAMLINRIADARFDAENPRTRSRALPSGALPRRHALAAAALAAGLFVSVCGLFWIFYENPWPIALSVPVLIWIGFYSFTKRFTALCHLFLGGALAAAPLAAALAVHPPALPAMPALWLLAGMVALWVAGFDMIYALADIDADRRLGLRSIPSALGWSGALWVSRALHAAALALLIAAWQADPRLGELFGLGVAATAALLIAEHAILLRQGRRGLDMAFFTLNGIVSCLLGGAGCVDLVFI